MPTFLSPAQITQALTVQGFFRLVGASVDEVGDGTCTLSVASRPELLQQNGLLHGGVIAFLIDNATTAAAATRVSADQRVITAEYKLNLLAPAVGDRLECRARVVRSGRQLSVASADVFTVTGKAEKLVACALATIVTLPPEREPRVEAATSV